MRELLHFLRQNRLALVVTSLACLFTLILWSPLQHFPFVSFIAGVTLCGWQGGFRSALLATILSTLVLAVLCFSIPFNGTSGAAPNLFTRLLVFALLGVVAAYLGRERLRATQAMEYVHAGLAGARDGLIFTDRTGHVTSLNSPAQLLVGWHPLNGVDQPLGLVLRLRHEGSEKGVDDFMESVLAGKDSLEFPPDCVVVSSQGKQTAIEGSAAPLMDGAQHVTGMVITLRDVTRRRLAEHAARKREEQWQALMARATQSEEALRQLQEEREKTLKENELAQNAASQSLRRVQDDYEKRLQDHEANHLATIEAMRQVQEEHKQKLQGKEAEHQQSLEALRRLQMECDDKLKAAEARQNAAESALRKAQEEFERVLAEERSKHEEQGRLLRAAHQETESRLAQALSRQQPVEEELERARATLAAHAQELAAERERHATGLECSAEEVERLRARHDSLTEELAQSHEREGALQQLAREQNATWQAREQQYQEKQQFLECLLESYDTGIFAFDRDCRLSVWNPAMERLTGFEKTTVLGKVIFEAFPALEETGESRHFLEVLEGKRVHASSGVLSLDGQRVLLDEIFVPHRGGGGEVLGGLVFVREVPQARSVERATEFASDSGSLVPAAISRQGTDWLSYN
ncbi:MAG TPA: PAS domain S-box protein [Gemmataceae bacterium]|nr:PAS domain S-box protein [Gemmataceae bacterium]